MHARREFDEDAAERSEKCVAERSTGTATELAVSATFPGHLDSGACPGAPKDRSPKQGTTNRLSFPWFYCKCSMPSRFPFKFSNTIVHAADFEYTFLVNFPKMCNYPHVLTPLPEQPFSEFYNLCSAPKDVHVDLYQDPQNIVTVQKQN